MLKPGVYKMMVKEACWTKSSGKGTDGVAVVAEVFDDAGASLGACDGTLWWTTATKARTSTALKAIGWGGKTNPDGSFIGPFKVVDGCLKQDDYNGNARIKLDWLGEPPFGAQLPKEEQRLNLQQAKLLAAEVKAAMGITEPEF